MSGVRLFFRAVGAVFRVVAAGGFVVMPLHAGAVQGDVAVGHLHGLAQQVGNAHPVARHGGEERHVQPSAERFDVERAAALLELVEHVQRAHEGHVALLQLEREQEVALQVGGVEHVDDGVDAPALQFVGHVGFFGTESAQGVSAGQVDQPDSAPFEDHLAHHAAHRHAAVVARAFVPAGRGVEERGLAAVGVAHQRDGDGAVGFRAVGGEVLAVRAAMRASAGMRGPWCGRGVGRLRRAGVWLPGWRFRRAALFVRQPHLYLLRFAFPQCDLSAHQFKHDGISHGGAEDFPDAFSRDKSHFTQSGAERPATFYM